MATKSMRMRNTTTLFHGVLALWCVVWVSACGGVDDNPVPADTPATETQPNSSTADMWKAIDSTSDGVMNGNLTVVSNLKGELLLTGTDTVNEATGPREIIKAAAYRPDAGWGKVSVVHTAPSPIIFSTIDQQGNAVIASFAVLGPNKTELRYFRYSDLRQAWSEIANPMANQPGYFPGEEVQLPLVTVFPLILADHSENGVAYMMTQMTRVDEFRVYRLNDNNTWAALPDIAFDQVKRDEGSPCKACELNIGLKQWKVDASGRIHVVFELFEGSWNLGLFASLYVPGEGWQGPITIYRMVKDQKISNAPLSFRLSVNAGGQALLAWLRIDSSDSNHIRAFNVYTNYTNAQGDLVELPPLLPTTTLDESNTDIRNVMTISGGGVDDFKKLDNGNELLISNNLRAWYRSPNDANWTKVPAPNDWTPAPFSMPQFVWGENRLYVMFKSNEPQSSSPQMRLAAFDGQNWTVSATLAGDFGFGYQVDFDGQFIYSAGKLIGIKQGANRSSVVWASWELPL